MGSKKKQGEGEVPFLKDVESALAKAEAEMPQEKEPLQQVELSLLGLLLKNNELYHEIRDTVKGEHFQVPFYRHVFEEIAMQVQDRHHVDAVTLREGLSKKCNITGFSEMLGEIELEFAAISQAPPGSASSEQLKNYAERVREGYYRRRLSDFSLTLHQRVARGEIEPLAAADEMHSMAREASRVLGKKHKVYNIKDVLRENFTQIEDIRDSKSRILGLPTGYYEIDDAISGLQKGLLYVIGARPSMGKTSLQTCILENILLHEQKPALFFSLEMSKEEIGLRMMCSHARVDSNRLRSGKITEEDYQRLVLAAGAIHDSRLFINDDPLTIEEILKLAHDYKNIENVAVISIDYLQKIKGAYGRNSTRDQDVGYISSELKNLAKELKVPVVVSAQLNRGPEGIDDRRPRLSHLRDSGQIEQEADVVILLYRDEYYDPETDKRGIAEAIIAKNRNGPTKTVELAFLNQFTRFENLATRPY